MTTNMSSPEVESLLSCSFETCTREDILLILGPALKLLDDFQKEQPMDLSMVRTALLSKTLDELPEYTKLVNDGIILGWYHLIPLADALELDDVTILEPYRSRGLGSLILDRVKQGAALTNLPIIATVLADNSRAIRFYQRHGFESSVVNQGKYLTLIYPPASTDQ